MLENLRPEQNVGAGGGMLMWLQAAPHPSRALAHCTDVRVLRIVVLVLRRPRPALCLRIRGERSAARGPQRYLASR